MKRSVSKTNPCCLIATTFSIFAAGGILACTSTAPLAPVTCPPEVGLLSCTCPAVRPMAGNTQTPSLCLAGEGPYANPPGKGCPPDMPVLFFSSVNENSIPVSPDDAVIPILGGSFIPGLPNCWPMDSQGRYMSRVFNTPALQAQLANAQALCLGLASAPKCEGLTADNSQVQCCGCAAPLSATAKCAAACPATGVTPIFGAAVCAPTHFYGDMGLPLPPSCSPLSLDCCVTAAALGFSPMYTYVCGPPTESVITSATCGDPNPVDPTPPPNVLTVEIDPVPASSATITLLQADGGSEGDGGQATPRVFGFFQLNQDSCEAGSCAIEMARLEAGIGLFTLNGTQVSGAAVGLPNPLAGTLDSSGEFSFNPGAVEVTAEVRGKRLGGTFNFSSPPVGSIASDGTVTLMFSASDSQASITAMAVGHFASRPPQANISAPSGPVQCNEPGAASLSVSAAGSSDPDGEALTYQWFLDDLYAADGVSPTLQVPLGNHQVTLLVTNTSSLTGTAQVQISVLDTQPPVFDSSSVSPDCLWPPDHEMVLFRLGHEIQGHAHDPCDPNPVVFIKSVADNQPFLGGGQGNTAPDFVNGTGAACLRAERQGTTNTPRVYTITLAALDTAGNETDQALLVEVPHDQSSHCLPVPPEMIVANDDPACGADVATAVEQPVANSLAVDFDKPSPAPHRGGCTAGVADEGGIGGFLALTAVLRGKLRRRLNLHRAHGIARGKT
jgi:hypothetical protein